MVVMRKKSSRKKRWSKRWTSRLRLVKKTLPRLLLFKRKKKACVKQQEELPGNPVRFETSDNERI
jgi:hypothetical protein